jgi:hypothetical protein
MKIARILRISTVSVAEHDIFKIVSQINEVERVGL